jgi:hypothetical protein
MEQNPILFERNSLEQGALSAWSESRVDRIGLRSFLFVWSYFLNGKPVSPRIKSEGMLRLKMLWSAIA